MPKLKVSEDERLDREFEGLISYHASRLGLKAQKEIAEHIGVKQQTYSARMKNKGRWGLDDLRKLFRRLQFTPEEIARVFK